MIPKSFLFLLLFQLVIISTKAQNLASSGSGDTDSIGTISNSLALYADKMGGSSSIYSGREYVGFSFRIKGDQYFISDDWAAGDLEYEGIYYQNVQLLYDMVRDELLISNPDNAFSIVLEKQKVKRFKIHDHTFVNLVVDDRTDFFSMNGFYDQLNNGEVKVLVKRAKTVDEEISDNKLHRSFKPNTKYFIKMNGDMKAIKSKNGALKLFPKDKKYIRKKLNKNKIRYRKDPEWAIVNIVNYYLENHPAQ